MIDGQNYASVMTWPAAETPERMAPMGPVGCVESIGNAVVTGTTLGILVADVPAVLVRKRTAPKRPCTLVRMVTTTLCACLGVGGLRGLGRLSIQEPLYATSFSPPVPREAVVSTACGGDPEPWVCLGVFRVPLGDGGTRGAAARPR
jgi:hypothetical protein